MEETMELTDRITLFLNKAVKEEKRISQVEIARSMDVAPASVNKWMSGGTPSVNKLPKLCEILGISPNELFDYHASEEEKKLEDITCKLKQVPEYSELINSLITQIIKDTK